MPPERLAGRCTDAAADKDDEAARAAVEQLVVLAPDDPAVESLLRARSLKRRV
jgi:hypothetical protein